MLDYLFDDDIALDEVQTLIDLITTGKNISLYKLEGN